MTNDNFTVLALIVIIIFYVIYKFYVKKLFIYKEMICGSIRICKKCKTEHILNDSKWTYRYNWQKRYDKHCNCKKYIDY